MNSCLRARLASLAVLLGLSGPVLADPTRFNDGGTPIDIGFRSPSRGWIDRSPAAFRGHWGGNRFYYPACRTFSYGYGDYFGNFYGGGFVSPGCWNVGCPYCGNYWCDGCCWGGTYWTPGVVVVNPGYLFGPQAVQNFLGVNNVPAPAAAPVPAPPAEPAVAPAVPLAPRTNATARERAIKFLQYGDRHFQAGRYREALARYKKAVSSAGDMAEAEFRKGFAELMMGDFSDATVAIRRGLGKNANWPQANFAIDDLFNGAAKAEAYRILDTRLQETDFDADAHFLLGVMLHFDGQIEAAQAQFLRTIELLGQAEHARVFLPVQPEVEAAAAVGQ